ncbi:MAG TPA: aldose epimerase [Rhodanobacteraceae bacterium]
MSRYAIRHEHLGAFPVVALIDTETGTAIRVARRGATLLEYQVPVAGRLCNIVDSYTTADELETYHGSRFAVMAPFANRVADARYHFAGVEHDLAPDAAPDARTIMHGFVRASEFDLLSVDTDDTGACLRLGCHALLEPVHAGYPFKIDLEVAFTLHASGLDVTASLRNMGDSDAPCFFGWHPYLRLREDGIDGLELKLPAQQAIVTNDALIPLPGDAAYRPLDAMPERDFRTWRKLDGCVLDSGFAAPKPDADGRIRSHLRDPETGLSVAMWQERGVTVVYTADTLRGAEIRRSIAIEPMEAMTNAFNRPDCAAAITLAPGAERTFHCGLELNLP